MGAEIKPTYSIQKRLGETPLEALERLRSDENIPADVPMTYAGRLDPAAEGELLILIGEECKNKEKYLGLDKTYVAEILFGVSTDSYDLLGIPTISAAASPTLEQIEDFLRSRIGTFTQTYPAYSSKTVDGKQLHTHTKEGTAVSLPEHAVSLHSYFGLLMGERTREELLDRARMLADIVTGDFRQDELRVAWEKIQPDMPASFKTISVTLTVSSGFYIRQFAEDLGRTLGTGACLYSLVRTRISK